MFNKLKKEKDFRRKVNVIHTEYIGRVSIETISNTSLIESGYNQIIDHTEEIIRTLQKDLAELEQKPCDDISYKVKITKLAQPCRGETTYYETQSVSITDAIHIAEKLKEQPVEIAELRERIKELTTYIRGVKEERNSLLYFGLRDIRRTVIKGDSYEWVPRKKICYRTTPKEFLGKR